MFGTIFLTQEETLIDSIFELRQGRKCTCDESREGGEVSVVNVVMVDVVMLVVVIVLSLVIVMAAVRVHRVK